MKKILTLMLMSIFILTLIAGSVKANLDDLPIISSEKSLNPFGMEKIVKTPITTDKVNITDFMKAEITEYPIIELYNNVMWIKTDKVAEYKITENTKICGENCFMEGKATLYLDSTLFNDAQFKDLNNGANKNLKYYKYFIREPVPSTYKEVCYDIGKDNKECDKVEVKGEPNKWEAYNYEVLKPGIYEWRLEGTKGFYEAIDAIPVNDKTFNEWADWGSGGTITQDGAYTVHTFLANGTFTFTTTLNASILVIAGGGAGAGGIGGGGGAGGINYTANFILNSGSYAITVGSGGVKGATESTLGTRGGNSSFNNLINATGGGYGGSCAGAFVGGNGGSGGGEGSCNSNYGTGITGQGYNGGDKTGGSNVGSGGGGAGAVGQSISGSTGGNGGDGIQNAINGSNIYYGGGGGGACYTSASGYGNGGQGGGGRGNGCSETLSGLDGTNGLGGGGGGGSGNNGLGGNGGSGAVIIRYLTQANGISVTNIAPIDTFNTTNTTINFNCSLVAVGENITKVTLNVTGPKNWTQNINSLPAGTTSYSANFTNSTLTDGLYSWVCIGYGQSGNNGTSSATTFRIDSTAPVINITYPYNNLQYVTFIPSNNLSLNFTAYDAGIGLSTCWYYNGTGNTTLTCGTNSSMNFTGGYSTIMFYANDTLNNLASTSSTFLVNYLQPLVNYSLTGVEGENSTFYFNITANNLTQANATINYNNTNYAMDILSYNGTVGAFYKTIILPQVSADTVKQFNISYYVNGIQYNTSLYNQTVYNIPALNISAGLCSGTPVYWFSLQDEENLSSLSGDFEYNFYYGLSNSSMVRTYGKITGSTNFSICTNTTISPTWTIGSGEILYSSVGYVDRRYYIFDNTVVTSATNLTLYDLLSTSQTSFKLEIEDTSLNPYSNIYDRLLRWYPDLNEYKIVDIGKTDETGSTVIHVRTEDVDYRIGAYQTNGSLIYLANPIRMVCLASPCTYTLKISPGEIDYTSFLNIVYTFNYNETTGIWDFTYSDTTGKTSTMNLTVYRVTNTGEYAVCSNSISGAVGALSCNTSIYTTGILRGEVYRSASPPVEIVQKVIHLFTSAFKGSSFGLWLSMLLALPVIFLLCLVSPIGAIMGGVIALLPALYFGSINIGIVGGMAVLGGIVAHFLKRIS